MQDLDMQFAIYAEERLDTQLSITTVQFVMTTITKTVQRQSMKEKKKSLSKFTFLIHSTMKIKNNLVDELITDHNNLKMILILRTLT